MTARSLRTIAHDLRRSLDARVVAKEAGFEPLDRWQSEYLTSHHPRHLLNIHRQSGKSSMSAVKAVHRAVYTPGSLILLLSPSLRQSSELLRKILHVYRSIGRPVPADSETSLTLELTNGSRILCLPGASPATIRSFSAPALIIIDEASRCADELYLSIRPMLATSGPQAGLDLLSTPYGQRGFYWREWSEGGEAWKRFEVPATLCARISPDFLVEERRSLGPTWFSQEYECCFVAATGSVFLPADINSAFDPTIEPLFPDLFAGGHPLLPLPPLDGYSSETEDEDEGMSLRGDARSYTATFAFRLPNLARASPGPPRPSRRHRGRWANELAR